MSIEHAHFTCANTFDFVRAIAELKDVARETLNRKILIQRADESLGRFEDDSIVAGVGNRAAVRDGRKSRATSPANASIHRVVMQVGSAPTAPRGEAFGQH